MDIREILGKRRLFLDGGTGTSLQKLGLKAGERPETWNLLHPERIESLHRAYLDAGADIIYTNTFGANRLKYPEGGEFSLEEVVKSAVNIAKRAQIACGREDSSWVALDIGPSGKLLRPLGDLDFEDAVALFAEVVGYGAAAGADLVVIETMGDSYELKAAVLAAKENSELPIIATAAFDERARLLTGGTPESVTALLEGLRVDALGLNCGLGPREMLPIAERFAAAASLPVAAAPNAGLPRQVEGRTVFDLSPGDFAAQMEAIARAGAQLLGGCCGTTPEHIAALAERCRELPFAEPVRKRRTVVSSFSTAVELGAGPVIVGERINPTGKPRLKEALRAGNMDYLLSEGAAQEDAGAQILDVNVGLPGVDEPAMLERAVTALQGVTGLPLQLDSSDARALERAMRRYNGKPMINSVSAKAESMAAVFPLIRKYGGTVVGLALDEGGIPETPEGRVECAERIYETAADYGIAREDVVIDTLTLTVSSEPQAAQTTLEALRRIHAAGGRTILGVSNVSFGLPAREKVNSAFLTLALEAGLDCAIMNPLSAAMMSAWRAFAVLTARDARCEDYIAHESGAEARPETPTAGLTLGACIEKGLADAASAEAKRLVAGGAEPLGVINSELIPALDRVGRGFEAGTMYLPQLLMSAEAAGAAFESLKSGMKGERGSEYPGKIVIATVKGDIHDIGKNIVRTLLENYGFDVRDLGKDVPPEAVLEAASQEGVRLVGLSALMTTTVAAMEETIKLLRERLPEVKIMVGGAVLNEEYARQIGADFYGRDAMASVRYAKTVCA